MMEIHNTTEDIVVAKVETIFDSIVKDGNPENLCLCPQCRMDTICYVLNRVEPRYIISNRGVARIEQDGFQRQQKDADITALVYEGLKRVNHNQRPNVSHNGNASSTASVSTTPVYNIPTIVGRLFNGLNFAPMSNIKIELHRGGDLVPMKDNNWQNPYNLVPNTEGTFTFWPNPIPAEGTNLHKIFEYSLKIEAPEFETLNHFFKIPVISEIQSASSFSMDRTFKLPDLYMFPPGSEDEEF
ncbi:MAG: late competence development ComFB family protein [Treponema sp.]|jgi:competence protein ComFB|nr:late competence development ComFB family protein [Treponema sp.]